MYQDDGDGCGYVPSSFLRRIGDLAITSLIETRDILGFIGSLEPVPRRETHTHTTKTESHTNRMESPNIDQNFEYVAIDSYQSSDTRQLSFHEGAVLAIIEKSEDGNYMYTLRVYFS